MPKIQQETQDQFVRFASKLEVETLIKADFTELVEQADGNDAPPDEALPLEGVKLHELTADGDLCTVRLEMFGHNTIAEATSVKRLKFGIGDLLVEVGKAKQRAKLAGDNETATGMLLVFGETDDTDNEIVAAAQLAEDITGASIQVMIVGYKHSTDGQSQLTEPGKFEILT